MIVLLLSSSAWAQDDGYHQDGVSYLLRLQRVDQYHGVCVLLRGDGKYHLEHHTRNSARIFEGKLNDDDLRNIIHIVSGDQLFNLRQEQISNPMLRSDSDRVLVSVLRPGYWQELSFPDSTTREPYHASLDPLLHWLEQLQKQKDGGLPEEEARNNCRPQANIELANRSKNPIRQIIPAVPNSTTSATARDTESSPAKGVAPDYILRMVDSGMSRVAMEMSCTIIFPSGAYHHVKQSRDLGSHKTRSRVLDGSFTETQIASLRLLLDAPELNNQPPGPPSSALVIRVSGESFHTTISFPRNGTIQNFEAWQWAELIGSQTTNNRREHGMKELGPLRQWIRTNLDESKSASSQNPPNARCEQGH